VNAIICVGTLSMARIIKNRKINQFNRQVIAILLAAGAMIGWLRFQQSLRYWYYFIEIGLDPHPVYLAVSGALIGIAFSLALILLLMRRRITRKFILGMSMVTAAWLWIDRLFVIQPASRAAYLPSVILLTALLIILNLLSQFLP